jgi:Acyclic terpene utilisation family protein AtuA
MAFQGPQVRLLAATGAVGFTPPDPERSFHAALEREPDAIVADAGSADIGPLFLGSDTAYNEPEWERLDLERLIDGAMRLGVPLVIGSCGGTGTDRAVESYAQMVDALGRSRGETYRTALIFAGATKDWLHTRIEDAGMIQPTTALLEPLSGEDVEASDELVAVMGAQPIAAALRNGAQIVLAGRACDDALFAAAAMARGVPAAPAFLSGKLLENASLVAEPFVLRESVIADVDEDGVVLEPMYPPQRCTRSSVAAQLMYERSTPFEQAGPGGLLDLSAIQIDEIDERRVALRGPRYHDAPPAVKVEGAGSVGYRSMSIAGIRDPQMIAALDGVVAEMNDRVVATGAQIVASVFGRDAVMGALEPVRAPAHEVAVIVETTAATQEQANAAALLAKRVLFSARYPGQTQSGGSIASMIDEFVECGPAYRWTVNHVVPVDDLLAPFPTEVRLLGADG